MKSRFAALLLAGIMTLSLVACGQQAAENTASTSEPETIVEQPSIPEGVLAIAEQGNVLCWRYRNHLRWNL